jgi:2-oxoglutarate ferredoxin oxidoreductase subunit alpha
MELNIRIAGEAGQGIETTGSVLIGALAGSGLHVFSTQDYMSRIRGGLNWFDIRLADHELFGGRKAADLLLALSQEALDVLRGDVAPSGVVLFEGEGGEGVLSLPFTKTAIEVGGSKIMANTVTAGAVLALLGCDLEPLLGQLRETLARKGADVVEKNIACARAGAALAADRAGCLKAPAGVGAPGHVYSGGDAVGLAAATAGVKFVTSYPMSPSTAVFTYLAGVADQYGIVVEQAEDEIAAINMICGATYAGVPAMATTSGGGFALMSEGMSLAGITEQPVLIFVAQRPGPATGLPTRTAQEDLRLALHAGHGEFPRAVYAPGTVPQAYELTRRALETAHKFRSPVILLADQFLVDCRKNIPALDEMPRPIDRHVVENPPEEYLSYAVTEDGVSPRALPGSAAFVVADSHVHGEDGHITEDAQVTVRMQDKRTAKGERLRADALPPELYGPKKAERLLICWGSTYGPCREAVDTLNADGASAAMLHFAQVWPLDGPAVRRAIESVGARTITCVEANASGQFASLLRQVGALDGCELLLRYDGRPFLGEEISTRIKP